MGCFIIVGIVSAALLVYMIFSACDTHKTQKLMRRQIGLDIQREYAVRVAEDTDTEAIDDDYEWEVEYVDGDGDIEFNWRGGEDADRGAIDGACGIEAEAGTFAWAVEKLCAGEAVRRKAWVGNVKNGKELFYVKRVDDAQVDRLIVMTNKASLDFPFINLPEDVMACDWEVCERLYEV